MQKFIDYYSARGWKINGEPINDVRALVRNWIRKTPHFDRVERNSKRSEDYVTDALETGIREVEAFIQKSENNDFPF